MYKNEYAMWNLNRLPAYTIIELIIIMVLTGILSAFTFSALGLFSQSFTLFHKVTGRSYELTLLHRLLTKDMDQAQLVQQESEKVLHCQYMDKNVVYEFDNKCIIRKDVLIDTFHVVAQNYKVALLPLSDKVVQALQFELLVSEQVIPYVFRKPYPADIFVNQNKDNP